MSELDNYNRAKIALKDLEDELERLDSYTGVFNVTPSHAYRGQFDILGKTRDEYYRPSHTLMKYLAEEIQHTLPDLFQKALGRARENTRELRRLAREEAAAVLVEDNCP